MIIVSKCCAGVPCRYHCRGTMKSRIATLGLHDDFVAVCPEMLGGLPCPREGCSIVRGRVIGRRTGCDYTAEYTMGAYAVLEIARTLSVEHAYLLGGSPSCGRGYGLTARLLESHGITVHAL